MNDYSRLSPDIDLPTSDLDSELESFLNQLKSSVVAKYGKYILGAAAEHLFGDYTVVVPLYSAAKSQAHQWRLDHLASSNNCNCPGYINNDKPCVYTARYISANKGVKKWTKAVSAIPAFGPKLASLYGCYRGRGRVLGYQNVAQEETPTTANELLAAATQEEHCPLARRILAEILGGYRNQEAINHMLYLCWLFMENRYVRLGIDPEEIITAKVGSE